jgi:hypothetical protein
MTNPLIAERLVTAPHTSYNGLKYRIERFNPIHFNRGESAMFAQLVATQGFI